MNNFKPLPPAGTTDAETVAGPDAMHAAQLASLLKQFDAFQWLSGEDIIKRQYASLAMLAAHAARTSPYFRQRLENAGMTATDLASPEGLSRLPLLTRHELQTAQGVHSQEVPMAHLPLAEAKSSGSTGQPVVIKKTALNQLIWDANMMREHSWHKRDFSGRILTIRATTTAPVRQEGWGNPVDLLYPSGPLLGVPVTYSAQKIIDSMLEFKPQHVVIYPNTLEAIVSLCEKERIAIAGIEHIWSIGETLKPKLRQRASALFGASIEDDYSSQETGIMALQCPLSGLYHVMAESIILEVLDDKGKACREGDIGKIVVTDLYNYATPMIRYDIGDYAEVGGICPCGRGLPTLKCIKGRSRNLAVKPDGSRHWPPLSLAILRSGVQIRQFQIVQHSLEKIEARLVPEKPLSEAEEQSLVKSLQNALDYPFSIHFTYFNERIPLAANGKFEDFISHV